MSDTNTTVKQVEVEDINTLFNLTGADSVLLPEDDKKPSFFSKSKVDFKFLDETPKVAAPVTPTPAATTTTPVAEVVPPVTPEPTPSLESVINEVEQTPATEQTQGRPKIAKEATVEVIKKLIDKKLIVPFDDDKKLEDYTLSDYEELFEANFKDREDQIRQQVPQEFYSQLPEEMQLAANYIQNGGTDIKGMFRVLSQAAESAALSPQIPEEGESIIREYLTATQFGTREDIDEEINSWKDLNKIEEKASKFKPKLEALRSEIIANQLAQQEAQNKQRQEAAQNYANSVYETLKPAELNGVKLDKKTQGMLYSGLVQPAYPSISGRQTNLLGHLLEKYQFVEPNHSLIAEVLWHLSDPDGFKAKLREAGKIDATEKTVRMLKTEQSSKIASSPVIEKEETTQRRIPRTGNFFKR